MAAPMTPAEPMKNSQVRAKEAAIKRKLAKTNNANKTDAYNSINKYRGGTKDYDTKYISGSEGRTGLGFSQSDYGVLSGAAVPYQILSGSDSVTRKARPKPKPKPKPKYRKYTVKRGDTLVDIAKKFGMDWQDIWDYNLEHRKPSTVRTLKRRGPNLIYRGGMFYIPED